MTLLDLIQLIIRNKKWVLYFPIIVGIGVFVLTRNTPHTYTSEMVIYTGIASGFNPDNDFENKIDFHAVNSRFDNLINIIGSRETRKDVGLKLLAHMLTHKNRLTDLLENSKNNGLTETINDAFIKRYYKGSEEETERFLRIQLDSGRKNVVYQLLYGEKKNPFNVKTLEDIKAKRDGNSDMLKIEYTCEDPFTCKLTLDITSDLFLKKYQDMRIGEANQAVKYFKEQTTLAKGKLSASEENLKRFRSANRVINYYEQTKYIADQNEYIEKTTSQLQMELDGYTNALAKVESKIGNRFQIILQSDKIVQAKTNLATELSKTGFDAVRGGTPAITSNPKIEGIKNDLRQSVENLYALNNSTEGMPGKTLLEEWLKLTVSKEESESKLKILTTNKVEFDKVFDRYAPMGSELNKLEREVETAEKEYLNLLHSLNQAILRERNLEVSETISVIDDADLPVVPNPAKRFMLIIASVLSCVIISVVLLIIRQYLDSSVASPLRMEKITGITAATAFLLKTREIEPNVLAEMCNRATDRWKVSLIEGMKEKQNSTFLTIPFNCAPTEMNKYVEKLQASLTIQGQPFKNTTVEAFETPETNTIVTADKNYPEQLSKNLFDSIQIVFFFFDASQKLDEYQLQVIENWRKTGLLLKGVLINTTEQHISKYLGDVPHKRSKLRTFIKKQFIRYAT